MLSAISLSFLQESLVFSVRYSHIYKLFYLILFISRWAEPTDYRFCLRVFFFDTNLQIACVIIPKLLLAWCATYAWNNDGVDSVAELYQKLTSLQVCCCASMQAIWMNLGTLRRIKPFVPITTLQTIYRALIQPYFDYCSPIWGVCDQNLKNKLQKFQNRAARIIVGASYEIRSADVLQSLAWDNLETRRRTTKAILMFKKFINNSRGKYKRNECLI